MSDNVRFGTVNDLTTTSNSSGFNGFPFPIVSSALSELYPISMTFIDLVELWWRIKTPTLSTDVTIDDGVNPTYTIASGDFTRGANPSRELDLIQPDIAPAWDFPDNQGTLGYMVGTVSGGQIREFSSSLYPELAFAWQGGAFNQALISSEPTPPAHVPAWSSAGSITGSFMGYSLTVYFFTDDGGATTITGTYFDISPVEWWPYAQLSDGLAIYDTSTGLVLTGRSPLN